MISPPFDHGGHQMAGALPRTQPDPHGGAGKERDKATPEQPLCIDCNIEAPRAQRTKEIRHRAGQAGPSAPRATSAPMLPARVRSPRPDEYCGESRRRRRPLATQAMCARGYRRRSAPARGEAKATSPLADRRTTRILPTS